MARYRATLHPEKVSPLFCVAQIYASYKLFANEKRKIKLTSCYIATYCFLI
ncbi:hypothetical protein SPHINGO8BC_150018 [Sphingobacterium multivorum]|uniref:Uncharacterized protein n=1 Tax=Sphingobacterium multivorum TaxID=28454 RepID=A0A653ZSF5_SPHMU|nr:hypothetical protein SPHINGO8BC_150018 [Sphingobacterium multivorum]